MFGWVLRVSSIKAPLGSGSGWRSGGGHAEDLMISHRDNDAMLMAMATIGSDVVSSEDNDSGDDSIWY